MGIIERTLVLAKADVLERGLLGRIIQRFEDTGLKIVAAKLVRANRTIARKHYTGSRIWKIRIAGKVIEAFKESGLKVEEHFGSADPMIIGGFIHKWSIDYLVKNPVLALILEGPHAVERVDEVAGITEPRRAGRGTIRGDFAVDSIVNANLEKRAIFNMVHSSRTVKDAQREIKTWFKPKEILAYKNNYQKVVSN